MSWLLQMFLTEVQEERIYIPKPESRRCRGTLCALYSTPVRYFRPEIVRLSPTILYSISVVRLVLQFQLSRKTWHQAPCPTKSNNLVCSVALLAQNSRAAEVGRGHLEILTSAIQDPQTTMILFPFPRAAPQITIEHLPATHVVLRSTVLIMGQMG